MELVYLAHTIFKDNVRVAMHLREFQQLVADDTEFRQGHYPCGVGFVVVVVHFYFCTVFPTAVSLPLAEVMLATSAPRIWLIDNDFWVEPPTTAGSVVSETRVAVTV